MALTYKLFQIKSGNADIKGMWRARLVYEGTKTLADVAEHMHNHNTPYSQGAIQGILTDMVNCIIELTAQGYIIDIPNFARFKAKIKAMGVEKLTDFKVNTCVKNVVMTVRAKQNYNKAWMSANSRQKQGEKPDHPIEVVMQSNNTLIGGKQD